MRNFFTILAVGALVGAVWGVPVLAEERGLDAAGGILQQAGKPTGLESSFDITVSTLIRALLGTVGAIFLILTVYSGILWMSAQGNETRIEKAKNILIAAVIGISITTMSYAITNFVLNEIASGNTQAGTATTT